MLRLVRWLVKNGEIGKALSVLQRLRGGPDGQNANVAQEELDEIVDNIEDEKSIGEGSWREIFCAPDITKRFQICYHIIRHDIVLLVILKFFTVIYSCRVIIGCGCQFFQQFSGINVVM